MIKRLKYISRSTEFMSEEKIQQLAQKSIQNNQAKDITGVLVVASGIFFQVIEGPEKAVNALYEKISNDTRHGELLLLNTRINCETRLFPEWAMKTVRLGATDTRAEAIKLLLETAVESHKRLHSLTEGIERFVWAEVSANPHENVEPTD